MESIGRYTKSPETIEPIWENIWLLETHTESS